MAIEPWMPSSAGKTFKWTKCERGAEAAATNVSTIKPLERIIITTKWSGNLLQANLLFEMAAIAGMAKRLRAIAPTEAVVTFGLESSADVPISRPKWRLPVFP